MVECVCSNVLIFGCVFVYVLVCVVVRVVVVVVWCRCVCMGVLGDCSRFVS